MRFCRDPTVRRQVAAKLFEDGDDTSVLSLPFPREMVKNADYLGSGKVRVQVTDTRGRDLLSTTWFESQFLQVTIRSLKGRVLFQYGCENIQDDLLHQWRRFVIWMGIAAVYRLTQRLEKAATQPAAPSRKPAAQPSASPKRKRSSVTSGTKPKLVSDEVIRPREKLLVQWHTSFRVFSLWESS